MPLSDFAFVVTVTKDQTVEELVLAKARETFGKTAKLVALISVNSGAIRFFKKRGIPVTKKGPNFFIDGKNGTTRQIVRATIDVPQEFIIRQMGGNPGAVDLSELAGPEELLA